MSGIPRGLSKSLPIRSSTKDCSLGTLPPAKHHLPHFSQCLTPCAASACLGAQLWLQESDRWESQRWRGQGVSGVPLWGLPGCSAQGAVLTDSLSSHRGHLCLCTQHYQSAEEQLLRYEQDPEEKSPSQVTLSSGGKLRIQGQSRGAEGGWGN